ncbi:MAG: ATP-binding protein, partial [Bacteroidetes bacterium]|nr:ATP-binding protein [Bacteroidota bacterium]
MKRTLLILTIVLLTLSGGNAQQLVPMAEKDYADSLATILRSGVSDSSRSIAGYLLSDYWRFRDTAKSQRYLAQGRQLAGNYPYLRALYHFYEGQYYFNIDKGKAAQAYQESLAALAPYKTPAAYSSRAASWYNYALMVRNEKGDDFVTDILLNQSIPLSQLSGDVEKTAHYYVQLATLLMNNARFDKAEVYNQKAIDLLEKQQPACTTLLFAYLSATSTYIYDSKNAEARKFLDKALRLLEPFPGSINYPDYYYNEGLYYVAVGALDKAIVSLDKGINLARKYHQGPLLQILVFRKYEAFLEQKNYRKAKEFLMGLVDDGNLMAEANNRRSMYAQLAKTNAYLGDMKEAYRWSSRYSRISDSMHGAQLKEKIASLEARYQNSENQKTIAALQQEKARAELSAKNSRLFSWLLGTICLLLLVTAAFSWSFVRNQKKMQQLKVTRAMLDGEERERRRIARDLHDGLGGMLAGVKINLSGLAEGGQPPPHDLELHKIIGQLDSSIGELRYIARNMMPETLLKYGLQTALKDLCEFHMRGNVRIAFQPFNIQAALPLPLQINIYRIVQEIVANAVRHAQAKNIILQCSQNDPGFFITVEDDGIGFDQEELRDGKGMGLMNVRSRVNYMKGRLEV